VTERPGAGRGGRTRSGGPPTPRGAPRRAERAVAPCAPPLDGPR
jgi:hypothetical protein